MSQDLSKLSKADLLKHIAELEAAKSAAPAVEPTAPAPAPAAQPTVAVADLVQALIAAREVNKATPTLDTFDGTLHKLTNTSGMALGIEVTDERTGTVRTFSLPRPGDFCQLTKGQVQQLREKAPHFFDRGYVSVPSLVADTANVIRNQDAFLNSIAFEEIDARIGAIDSVETLFTLFNHIETKRFVTEDKDGKPLTEKVDGADRPVVKEVTLEPKLRAIESAVKARIESLKAVKINIDGK